ncbi:TetR/AcrR family transcriptional regulator [Streptomyces sp. ISL-94]|nr:TetR/AcrR family transcriptional regulator [Streptomyces sp. ISL-94]
MRNLLYESALALFAEQGYEGTTIDQITERADVARGTFFNHFQRKEDLVSSWAQQRKEQLIAQMAESLASGDDVTVQLERCMAALAKLNESDRDLTCVMLTAWVKSGQPMLEEPAYAGHVFADIVRLGQGRGEVTADVDPFLVGNLLRDSYLGILYRWSQAKDGQVPLAVELRALLRVVLSGVRAYDQRS